MDSKTFASCKKCTSPIINIIILDTTMTDQGSGYRRKRYDLPEPGYKVVETVFVMDAKFMEL